MDEQIKIFRDECIILRNLTAENDKVINELLKNPIVNEFFELYLDNIKLKEKLSSKEKMLAHLEMCECQHAFVMTGLEKDSELGIIMKAPIYHCVKCGLTNYYDVTDTNDLVDETKSQMGYIFADTFRNGILLSNSIISLSEAIETYNEIINSVPDITNTELKKMFPIVLGQTKKLKEKCGLALVKVKTSPRNLGSE